MQHDEFLLPDEEHQEYETHREAWVRDYPDESVAIVTLREEVIRAHWLMSRYRKQDAGVRKDSTSEPSRQNRDDLKQVQRDHAVAERSFYRALNLLERFSRTKAKARAEESKPAKHTPPSQKQPARNQQNTPFRKPLLSGKKNTDGKLDIHEVRSFYEARFGPITKEPEDLKQHIWVSREDGQTVIKVWPPNETIVDRMTREWPPAATHVVRYVKPMAHDLEGYEWLTSLFAEPWPKDATCYQRMRLEQFQKVTAREQEQLGGQHVGPTNEKEDEDWEGLIYEPVQ